MAWRRALIGSLGVALAVLTMLAAIELTVTRATSIVVPAAERTSEVFRDCATCPEMLRIEPGQFRMGPPPRRRDIPLEWIGLKRHQSRDVAIKAPFAVGRFEVTFDDWDACVADGGCDGYRPPDEGWGRGKRPVIHVSWNDAHAYVNWLSAKTGASYRLLSDAEWEYAARAGSTSIYPWGNTASHEQVNYGEDACCTGRVLGRDAFLNTAPVGQFPPNAFGLHDMMGNVYEWVEDCFTYLTDAGPVDGAPLKVTGCSHHVMRGAAWYSDPGRITSSYRAYQAPDYRGNVVGFRVAKTLQE